MPENHCIFCKIVAGTAPCHRVHEDDQTLTFLDLFPASPGHCLIITRDHHEDIFTASEAELARVAANSLPLARAIKRVTGQTAWVSTSSTAWPPGRAFTTIICI